MLRLTRWLVLLCLVSISPGSASQAASDSSPSTTPESLVGNSQSHDILRTASLWNIFGRHENPVYDSLPGNVTPHPAVARIIVPEDGATAFGSGTLVAINDNHGLVVTNWHVVRDGVGLVDVVFPDGFHSHARPIKVDSDWDLAALVIWRPSVDPVKIAAQPPRPGELLTIHGYGRGQYRIATGHCTTYYAPRADYPHEMVELDVEARQGDSGGPIFNQAGELAGVLFGAGQGTTLGSFSPRVRYFVASAVPDFEKPSARLVAVNEKPSSLSSTAADAHTSEKMAEYPSSPWSPSVASGRKPAAPTPQVQLAGTTASPANSKEEVANWSESATSGWYDPLKTLLAAIGLTALTLRVVKSIR